VTYLELPFLIDLHLFLGRPLLNPDTATDGISYTDSLILGPFSREEIDDDMEFIKALDEKETSLPTLRAVMTRGHAMYERSQGKASPASYTRAKAMSKDHSWGFAGEVASGNRIHPVLTKGQSASQKVPQESRRILLEAVSNFKPSETVFELGSRGKNGNASLMKDRRKALQIARSRMPVNPPPSHVNEPSTSTAPATSENIGMEGVEVRNSSLRFANVLRF
jgi:ATP-dependent RNA helicase DDX54/DBP10